MAGLSVRLVALMVSMVISSSSDAADKPFIFECRVNDLTVSTWNAVEGNWDHSGGVLSATGTSSTAILQDIEIADFELNVDLLAQKDSRAGVVFRVSSSTQQTAQLEGYFVGIDTVSNSVIWQSIDDESSNADTTDVGSGVIATRPWSIPANKWFHLRLVVRGRQVQAWINKTPVAEGRFPKIDGVDDQYGIGGIGLKSTGSAAEFRNVSIVPAVAKLSGGTYTNPVQSICADPAALLHDGTYYIYCTYPFGSEDGLQGIRLYTSTDLANWTDEGFVITNSQSWGESSFWAPDIIQKDGKYCLYYAADTRICVAESDHPAGPFRQIGNSPMLPDTIRIDAHVFRDDDGQFYFYYVKFDDGNQIWAGKLNDDMVTVQPDTLRLMVKPDQAWEQHGGRIVEGPVVLKHKGTYYLTYSGSHFQSPEYAIGYATSDSPLGPWTKYVQNPIMKSTAYVHGAAHHDFVDSVDGSETFVVYHRHFSLTQTEPRRMAVDRVQFVEQSDGPDIIEIWGPTSSPQPGPTALPSGS